MTMWQSIGRWVLAEETAQVIAGYWDKVGVRTKVQVLEWAEYNKRSAAGAHKDCFYYAFINGTWDASYTVQRFKPDFQTFRYFDASGDLLKTIEEYERTFDPEEAQGAGGQGAHRPARRGGVALPLAARRALRRLEEGEGLQDAPRQLRSGCATPTWRPEALPFLLRRLRHAAIVAVGVSLVVFGLVHLSGDPVLLMVSSDAPPDVVATTRHALGFDRPLHEQFTDYVARAAQRRPRRVPAQQPARGHADPGAAARHRRADGGRAPDRGGDRGPGRHRLRGQARLGGGPAGHGGRGGGPGGADLLARAAADRVLRRVPPLASRLRPRLARPPGPARGEPLHRDPRAPGPPGPLEHAGGPRPGLRAHRARQGRRRGPGARPATRSRTRRSRSSPCSACSSPSSWAARW